MRIYSLEDVEVIYERSHAGMHPSDSLVCPGGVIPRFTPLSTVVSHLINYYAWDYFKS